MPTAKKPRKKAAGETNILPDRQAMESYVASTARRARDDALYKAQELIYDAWESTNSRSRVTRARRALAISPLCADAFNLLAGEAMKAADALDMYTRGLAAGELALGAEGFAEYDGEFWGFLETRPYMRARQGLAVTLLELHQDEAAIDHLRAMLRLNPGDNQGIRYLLLACLLRRGDTEAVKALLREYPDEWSTQWLYTRALIAYREGGAAKAATLKRVRDAVQENGHVPAILAGTMPRVFSASGYLTVGGPDEASEYVREFGGAWRDTPGAVDWLAGAATSPASTRRRPGKSGE